MSDVTFSVKNFEQFQHYKDRSPPWIKLYNTVLRDYDFARLHDTVKWHLVGIWSLASQHNNRIPYDSAWVQQQIGATERVDIDALADGGWLVVHHASKPLARRKQSAMPEKRTETETENIPQAPSEPPPQAARKGTKLSDGWVPLPSDLAYAEQRGFSAPQIADIAENFRTYWTAGAGRNKTHADWGKAWQSWIRKEKPHVAGPGRKAAVLDPDEQVRRRRAQIAGGVAAIRERGRHDTSRESGDAARSEAGAGRHEPDDHARADGGGNGPHGRVGGDVQPPAKGLGQGRGFLLGGFEASAGGPVGDRDGAGEGEPSTRYAPATAPGDRYPGAGRTEPAHGAQDQAVPGAAMPGSGPGADTLPGHDASAEGTVRQDAGGLEQQIQLANRELTDQPVFLRRVV